MAVVFLVWQGPWVVRDTLGNLRAWCRAIARYRNTIAAIPLRGQLDLRYPLLFALPSDTKIIAYEKLF